MAAGSSSQPVTRLTPIDEPPRAGLTKTGSPSRSRSLGVQRRLRRPQHLIGADRKSFGDKQFLGELFVHPGRAGQHTGADIGHAGELEQALDGAVFAVRSVQHREDHVDGCQHLGPTGRQ